MATQILRTIMEALETRNPEFLVFQELDPIVSTEILDNLLHPNDNTNTFGCRIHFVAPDRYLKVVMPTTLHESSVIWMRNEFKLWMCYNLLTPTAGVAIFDGLITQDKFLGDFEGSSKTPDLCYIPCINGIMREFPTVVLESGWTESQAQLLRDCQIWHEGSGGGVRIVILFKMFPPNRNNQIKATLTFCRYGVGNVQTISSYLIFPPPAQPVDDPWITIDELFGSCTPDGLNPETQLPLSINRLRIVVGAAVRRRGHEPVVN
ncbi:hypothetical protein HOY80DRAFT_1100847 [Tuber brumale]|nr:hypothetical protein HOY80DRAFT_1100847 [Tuber brumale]